MPATFNKTKEVDGPGLGLSLGRGFWGFWGSVECRVPRFWPVLARTAFKFPHTHTVCVPLLALLSNLVCCHLPQMKFAFLGRHGVCVMCLHCTCSSWRMSSEELPISVPTPTKCYKVDHPEPN